MTKEPIKISIDSDVLNQAKKTIPNISGFVEECLKTYLGTDGFYPVGTINELNKKIGKCQLEIHLINEKNKIEENIEKAKHDEINLAWRRLYAEYRDTKHINQLHLENASKTLGVTEEELFDIVEVAHVFRDETKIDITEWEEVYKEYGYGDDQE